MICFFRLGPWIAAACIFFLCEIAPAEPLKVFILAGQSNMQGHAHLKTMPVMGLDPQTAPLLAEMTDNHGNPIVCKEVWISSLGSADQEQTGNLTVGYGAAGRGPKIGPEFTFGITMYKLLDQPILIIKTAWGGKSLNTDFRPPSAGPYEFSEPQRQRFMQQGKDLTQITAEKKEATGKYYRLMISHIKDVLSEIERVYPDYDPNQGYRLEGFVWFQGWNDMVDSATYPDRGQPGSYDQYSELLIHLIRDVRSDLEAPNLPFVVGVMGTGGPVDKYSAAKQRYANIHREFRNAMAAPAKHPEFAGSVANVLTENYWDLELEAILQKDRQIQATAREKKADRQPSREEDANALRKLRKETFNDRQLRLLEEGVSNAEYHYLGSAKILGQIGQAFAHKLHELMEHRNQMLLHISPKTPTDR